MIAELALDPKDFFKERQKFFNYFRKKTWAPDYIMKLSRLTNLWGYFCSLKRNTHFQPLPRMNSTQVQKLVDARENVQGLKRAADHLKWETLKAKKGSFESEDLLKHWNWMFIGLWFGLRPLEVDNLRKGTHWRVEWDATRKIDILWVYQTKLTSKPKNERWKPIPIHFPEQKLAMKLIEAGEFTRPLPKTLKRIFEANVHPYSARKGFTDLMLSNGFALEDVSVFLGHSDISITWKHYKDKLTFKLPAKAA
jgi:integrase